MLVARTTIGSAPRTTLIWAGLGLIRWVSSYGSHSHTHDIKNHWKSDPFTCFTHRRIDVRKRSKPSILTIPSGTHLPVTIYQRYWTHIVVPPPLKHFSNVALTAPFSGRITTNLGRHKKWGKWKIFFVSRGLMVIMEFYVRRYVNYLDLLWICYFCPR